MQDRATHTEHTHGAEDLVDLHSLDSRDPVCLLGTPVCLPAVVWYENTGGRSSEGPLQGSIITPDGF